MIDEEGKMLGIMDLAAALSAAREKKLDLVEIAPTAVPPVAKIIDLGKYVYQQEKQQKKQKTKHKAGELKAVKIGQATSEHDMLIKIKQLEEFLKEGYKVKVEMFLRGRERANKEFARKRFLLFLGKVTMEHKVEQPIKQLPSGFIIVLGKQ